MLLETKYSVLMSIYIKENPQFFVSSLESMLDQTLKPDEIVIVEDGPLSNELISVIERYVTQYPRLFTIVKLQKNQGLGEALNEGIKHCRNELVARMDTDDISLKERCQLQVDEFNKNQNLSIVGTLIDEFIDDPNVIIHSRVVPLKHNEIYKFSRRRNPFNHPTVMYRKSAVLSVGGYSPLRRNQDFDLFIRMLLHGCISMNLNKSLLLFRANVDNLHRRKSWNKCMSYVSIVYSSWKKRHSSILDLLIVLISQVIVFISPAWVLKSVTSIFLRKGNKGDTDKC